MLEYGSFFVLYCEDIERGLIKAVFCSRIGVILTRRSHMLFSDKHPMRENIANLDKPFSVDQDGNLVTMAEYIAVYGHEKVRAAISNPTPDPNRTIKAVSAFTVDDLYKLAEAFTLHGDDDTTVSFMGGPSFNKQQRLESVRNRGFYGQQFVHGLRGMARMTDQAIRGGWIEFVKVPETLEVPSLKVLKKEGVIVESLEENNSISMKVQLVFDPKAMKTLEDLKWSYSDQQLDPVDDAEVIRDALGFLSWAAKEIAKGNRVCVVDKNGVVVEVFLPFQLSDS